MIMEWIHIVAFGILVWLIITALGGMPEHSHDCSMHEPIHEMEIGR